MRFYGLNTMNRENNVKDEETPDGRNFIIDESKLKTRAGCAKQNITALSSFARAITSLESDTGIPSSNIIIRNDGTVETLPIWSFAIVNKAAWTAENGNLPFIFEITAQDTNYSEVYSTYLLYFPQGDFDVQVDYEFVTWANQNTEKLGLVFLETDTIRYTVERVYADTGAPLVGNGYVTSFNGTLSFTATSDTTGKLRLTRVGAVYTGYYWSSSNWVTIASATGNNTWGVLYLDLWNDDTYTNPITKVKFSNFLINSGVITPL